jgi:hypothetical protein
MHDENMGMWCSLCAEHIARMASTWTEILAKSFYTRIWRVGEQWFPTLLLEEKLFCKYVRLRSTSNL